MMIWQEFDQSDLWAGIFSSKVVIVIIDYIDDNVLDHQSVISPPQPYMVMEWYIGGELSSYHLKDDHFCYKENGYRY